jgi:ADP-ribose pyrophosphatase YjhB (NUDIX family)
LENIRVGCAVLVTYEGSLLLGKRGKSPNYGMMIIPGGGIEWLESMTSTALREVKEETGLDIIIEKQLKTYEIIKEPDEHRIIIYWQARYSSGKIKPSSDLLEAAFYSKQEIKQLDNEKKITDLVRKVLIDYGWLE